MKNIIKLLSAVLLLFATVACEKNSYNEEYLPGFNPDPGVTDAQTVAYTLADTDYKSIADNEDNKAIAKAAGLGNELTALGTQKYFTDKITAKEYLPAFLKAKYDTYLDNGSSVQVSYNLLRGGVISEIVAELSTAVIYKLANKNYEKVWGKDTENYFFSPKENAAKHLPAILASAKPDAVSGDLLWVDYNITQTEPLPSTTIFEEPFDDWATTWTMLNTGADVTKTWVDKNFSGNKYIQCSAFKGTGTVRSILVSPKITVGEASTLTFDACYGNYAAAGGRITVKISSDLGDNITADAIAAATWTDITSSVNIPIPSGTYGTLGNVCTYAMKDFKDKDVRVSITYDGNGTTGATTTVQIDNVVVIEGVKTPYTGTSSLYKFADGKWGAYTPEDVCQIRKEEFLSMGSKYDSFDASFSADIYLPIFLKQSFPYAQPDDEKTTVYKFYDSGAKATLVVANQYIYDGTAWIKTQKTQTQVGPFEKVGGKWSFNPSMTIILNPDKSVFSKSYYQAGVDYVIANKDVLYRTNKGAVSTDSEYYSGCASGFTNLNWRINTLPVYYWKAVEGEEAVKPYIYAKDATKEEIRKCEEAFYKEAEKRFGEVMSAGLATMHPEASPIEGIDIIYTVKMMLYTSQIDSKLGKVTHAFEFKLIDKGKFEYVKMYALDPQFELIQDKFYE